MREAGIRSATIVQHPMVRRPLLGRHGPFVVTVLCGYEIVALIPGSPLPSITEISQTRFRPLGLLLCVLGLHHFYLEDPEYYRAVMGGLADAMVDGADAVVDAVVGGSLPTPH